MAAPLFGRAVASFLSGSLVKHRCFIQQVSYTSLNAHLLHCRTHECTATLVIVFYLLLAVKIRLHKATTIPWSMLRVWGGRDSAALNAAGDLFFCL